LLDIDIIYIVSDIFVKPSEVENVMKLNNIKRASMTRLKILYPKAKHQIGKIKSIPYRIPPDQYF
jgi:hypothetical protein